jgi:hypothetical protein
MKMKTLDDTNQEFLYRALQKMHDRLRGQYNRFIEDQIRSIEDTKVKVNKRRGVITFIKTFPYFCANLESMLPRPSNHEAWDVRDIANDAYERVNSSMFECLRTIAKSAPGPTATNDPEDKEMLNYHILLIENMYHYVEEVDSKGVYVLENWRSKAGAEMDEHMAAYVGAVIRRPIGKLLDFIEGVEALLLSGTSAQEISSRHSHSKSTVKKLLSTYDSKEIRRGLEVLKKRIEKHFGDDDSVAGAGGAHDAAAGAAGQHGAEHRNSQLFGKVVKSVEAEYGRVFERLESVLASVYVDMGMEIEWRKEDITTPGKKVDGWWG